MAGYIREGNEMNNKCFDKITMIQTVCSSRQHCLYPFSKKIFTPTILVLPLQVKTRDIWALKYCAGSVYRDGMGARRFLPNLVEFKINFFITYTRR